MHADTERSLKVWGIGVALVSGIIGLFVTLGLWTPPAVSADSTSKAHTALAAQITTASDAKFHDVDERIKALAELQAKYEERNEKEHAEYRGDQKQIMTSLLQILGVGANAPSGPGFTRGRRNQ